MNTFCHMVEGETFPVMDNVSTDHLGTGRDKPRHMAAHQRSTRSGRRVVGGQCNLHMDQGHKPADEDTASNHAAGVLCSAENIVNILFVIQTRFMQYHIRMKHLQFILIA